MKIFATLMFVTLSMVPGFAGGCRGEHVEETASSCLPGMVWDEKAGTCVDAPSS